MKTIHYIYKYVLALIVMMTCAQHLQAQDAFYIYRNDGNFDGFFFDEIVRMSYSKTDLQGEEHDVYVVQEVETKDSLYRIPLSAIDSIGFQQPEIRMNPKFKNMDQLGMTPYITQSWGWNSARLGLSKSIPAHLLPQVGDVLATWDPSIDGGKGWVYKVKAESEPFSWLDEDNQSYYYEMEEVESIGDIFDQFITVEDIGVDDEGHMVRRRIAGCNPDGSIRRASGNSDVNILNLSGNFTREWKPSDDSSIGLAAEVGVLLTLRVAYNITWRRLFVKLSRDLIFKAKPSLAMSVSRGFDYDIDNFLPFRIPAIIFPATCPIFETSPRPEWFVRGEGKIEAKFNLPAVQLGIGEDIIIDTDEPFPVSYEPRLHPTVQGSVEDALDLGSTEVSLSGYLQTGLKFSANLSTASWFSKVFKGDIGLYLYSGPKIGGQISYQRAIADDEEDSPTFYNSLTGSYLHCALISLDLEAKATAAVFWKDPEEKKFFDKNWSFFADTVRLVPLLDEPKVEVKGNNATVTIRPKGGRTIGNCTLMASVYDSEGHLVETVGDWIYASGRDSTYYTAKFPLNDYKSATPYEVRTMLKWAGRGPINTGSSAWFTKTVSIDVDETPLEFGATEDLRKTIIFKTDGDPSLVYAAGNGVVKAQLDTLDKAKGLYEAVFTIVPNPAPFWDEDEVRIGVDTTFVSIPYTQKPNPNPVKFNYSSQVTTKTHCNFNGQQYDYNQWIQTTVSQAENSFLFGSDVFLDTRFEKPTIVYTLTLLDKNHVKVTATNTSTKGDGLVYTTNIEFTMVHKETDHHSERTTYTRYFVFEIVDGKYSTKSTLTRDDGGDHASGHQELIQTFGGEPGECHFTSINYVNEEAKYSEIYADVKSASYDSYLHSSSSLGGSRTYTEKGTLKEDDYHRFSITFE